MRSAPLSGVWSIVYPLSHFPLETPKPLSYPAEDDSARRRFANSIVPFGGETSTAYNLITASARTHLEGSRLPPTILAAWPLVGSPYAVQQIIQLVDFVAIPPLALRSSLNVKELKAASNRLAVGQESILSRAAVISVCTLLASPRQLVIDH